MKKQLTWIRKNWRKLCAGTCILTVSAGLLSGCGNTQTGAQAGQSGSDSQIAAATYPEAVAESMNPQQFMESDEHWNWWEAYREKADASSEYRESMNGYYQAVMKQILMSDGGNTVCSPLNTFVALAMLAEVSDGETRQQILDVLQVSDIESLRGQIRALWESNYIDTPTVKSLLANSLWLRRSADYNDETLRLLAEQYYASSFSGDPGSEEMNDALRKWTDDNTGRLLSEYTKEMALDPSLSDFTPLTKEADRLFLSTAVHAAMVEVDEEAVTGAAYTELALAEGAALPAEQIDFVLDRPFLFVITGGDGAVLFSGIVRNIK